MDQEKRIATVTLTFTDDAQGGVHIGTTCSVPEDLSLPDTRAMTLAAWCQALLEVLGRENQVVAEAVCQILHKPDHFEPIAQAAKDREMAARAAEGTPTP